jgi:hypothetical protein
MNENVDQTVESNVIDVISHVVSTDLAVVPPKPEISPQAVVRVADYKVIDRLVNCSSDRDVLALQVEELGQCVALATDIYKVFPVPDNAYQLSALTSAFNNSLVQLNKLQDPKEQLAKVNQLIQGMFITLVQSLSGEIEKTKREFRRKYPNDTATIEDAFKRMFESIQPESKNLYDNLNNQLKLALGIKNG